MPTNAPPPIKGVIKMLVPRVDKDGNELGGVPTVQRDAPLGTYLGWNITAGPATRHAPFHAGQVCNYVGGMVPFFRTKAQRLAAGDPRPVAGGALRQRTRATSRPSRRRPTTPLPGLLLAGPEAATNSAKCRRPIPAGFPDDWTVLVEQARESNVLCTTVEAESAASASIQRRHEMTMARALPSPNRGHRRETPGNRRRGGCWLVLGGDRGILSRNAGAFKHVVRYSVESRIRNRDLSLIFQREESSKQVSVRARGTRG